MNDRQLSRLADALKRLAKGKPLPDGGERPANVHKALGAGSPLPTAKQWATLTGLVERAGWAGLTDFRLLAFARHTVKVVELGEMTRMDMSKVITGMIRMLARGEHEEASK